MTDAARFDSIDQRLEQLTQALAEFRIDLQENRASILTLQALGGQLLEIVTFQQQQLRALQQNTVLLQQNAEQDRAEMRRIWEYLLQQRPNGRE
jgi:hypothetical protein